MVNVYFEYSASNNPEKCENLLCEENVQMKIFAKMINFVWLKCCFWCDQISKCHWLLVFFFVSFFYTSAAYNYIRKANEQFLFCRWWYTFERLM